MAQRRDSLSRTIRTTEARKILGLSAAGIYKYDGVLEPRRDGNGHRRYLEWRVRRLAAIRANSAQDREQSYRMRGYLDASQLAAEVGIGVRAVINWTRRGWLDGPTIKRGLRLYSPKMVDVAKAWLRYYERSECAR